ncbi:MAG TPA: putative baseplate assembly protein [Fimbriimonas sp.]
MESVVFCGSEYRREKVRAGGTLNGIDYLEVEHPSQTTLEVVFLLPLPPLSSANFRLEGGVRVRGVEVLGAAVAGNVATLTLDRRGDFSDYTLKVVAGATGDSPPAGFDARLCTLVFNFKVGCPSDFDCRPDRDCPEEKPEEAAIDYLAKDYATFRRLMLDRMTITVPDWRERNPSDMTVAIVEALAYVGDHLSYFQDSVATEAYLGTARRRTSVRRHARLLDYRMHEGCNARTFVCLEVAKGSPADGAVLPKGTRFLDRSSGEGARVASSTLDAREVLPVAFEAMHDLALSSARNRIRFHTWSDFDCCLPQGATAATLVREPGLALAPGDLLALYEVPIFRVVKSVGDPARAASECAEIGAIPSEDGTACYVMVREQAVSQRHVVRLKTVEPGRDAFEGVDVYEVSWFAEDALPFPLCLSMTQGGDAYADVSVACANVVLADQGQTMPVQPLVPDRPRPGEAFLPTLESIHLTFAAPYDADTAKAESASAAVSTHPHRSLASIRLRSGNRTWQAMPDHLRSGPFDPHFVVEVENDRSVRLRFGDDVNGSNPDAADVFEAVVRVGTGRGGNVGRDTLSRVVFDADGILNVWNPLSATGGVDPEPLEEVRQFAPEAYKIQERAVTEEDYAAVAERHPEVQSALARFRWTGSWYTVFLVVDRAGGRSAASDLSFRRSLLRHMDRYRMAGVDLELRDPLFVPLEIVLHVCVSSGYFRSDVERRLRRAFIEFFDPDRFTFGQDVYLSQILGAAMGLPGVDHVSATTFKRWGQTPNDELAKGRIGISIAEIAQLRNDPSLPENGRIGFEMEGGL